MRIDGRSNDDLRTIRIIEGFIKYPKGSVLIEQGDTKVLCSVTITDGVPPFLNEGETGWLTAEYAMLPASTDIRNTRESVKGKLSGRTQEISRLIGRSLRASIDLTKIKGKTILIDCDVLQADGGTRTASITGSFIALNLAIKSIIEKKIIDEDPIKFLIAAVSVGIYNNEVLLDLNFKEDQCVSADLNLVANENSDIIEIQVTAEKAPFSKEMLDSMLDVGFKGIASILELERGIIK